VLTTDGNTLAPACQALPEPLATQAQSSKSPFRKALQIRDLRLPEQERPRDDDGKLRDFLRRGIVMRMKNGTSRFTAFPQGRVSQTARAEDLPVFPFVRHLPVPRNRRAQRRIISKAPHRNGLWKDASGGMLYASSTGMTGQEEITFRKTRQGELLHEAHSRACQAGRVPSAMVEGQRGNTRSTTPPGTGLTLDQIFCLTRPVITMRPWQAEWLRG